MHSKKILEDTNFYLLDKLNLPDQFQTKKILEDTNFYLLDKLNLPDQFQTKNVLSISSNLFLKVWLFGFYGISTLVGHSMPNSVYIYIHIQPKISKWILRLVEFSISRISFVCTRLTNFKLSYFLVHHCLSQERQNIIYFDILEQIG